MLQVEIPNLKYCFSVAWGLDRVLIRMVFRTTAEFCKHSKLVAALIVAAIKIKHLAGNIS